MSARASCGALLGLGGDPAWCQAQLQALWALLYTQDACRQLCRHPCHLAPPGAPWLATAALPTLPAAGPRTRTSGSACWPRRPPGWRPPSSPPPLPMAITRSGAVGEGGARVPHTDQGLRQRGQLCSSGKHCIEFRYPTHVPWVLPADREWRAGGRQGTPQGRPRRQGGRRERQAWLVWPEGERVGMLECIWVQKNSMLCLLENLCSLQLHIALSASQPTSCLRRHPQL